MATGDTIDCSQSSGVISGSSNIANVSYQWEGPNGFTSADQNASITNSGIYVLTVTAPNNCTATDTAIVFGNVNKPDVNISATALNCTVFEDTITAFSTTAGVTYSWTGPNNFQDSISDIFINQTGIYTVQVTAPNGCIASETVDIPIDTTVPIIAASGDSLNCDITQTQVVVTVNDSTSSFLWNGPSGYTSNVQMPNVTQPGAYIIVVTAQNGCTATDTATVVQNADLPHLEATGGILTCKDSVVSLSAFSNTPNTTIVWTGPDSFFAANPDTIAAVAGVYAAQATDDNGCISIDSFTLSMDSVSPAGLIIGDTITCSKTTISVTGYSSQSVQYQWSGPMGYSADTATAELNTPGIYTLTMTSDSNGCSNTLEYEVETDTIAPSVSAIGGTITCDSGQITLSASSGTGNVQFEWLGPNGFMANTMQAVTTLPGMYTVTAIGENGCSNMTTAEVLQDPNVPDIAASADTITCAVPTAQLHASTTTSGVSYAWTGPANFNTNTQDPSTSMSGNYTLIITSSTGCSASTTVKVVTDTMSPSIAVSADALLNCKTDTVLLSTANSSSDIVSYIWTGPSGNIAGTTTAVATESGMYSLAVTAQNGCTHIENVEVFSDFTIPFASAGNDGIIDCNNTSTLLSAQASAQGDHIHYTWQGPAGQNSNDIEITTSVAGVYIINVLDTINGCENTDTAVVTADLEKPEAIITFPGADTLTCAVLQVPLSGQSSQPTGTLDFAWYDAAGDYLSGQTDILAMHAEDYTLIVTNQQNGCKDTTSAIVTEDRELPVVNIQPPDELTCAVDEVELSGVGSSTGSQYQYAWTANPGNIIGNNDTIQVVVNQIGQYMLTVYNMQNGCSAADAVTIEADMQMPTVSVFATDEFDCRTETVLLDGSASSQGSQYSHNWKTQNGNYIAGTQTLQPTVDQIGTYTLVITNIENGCTDSASVEVMQNENVPSDIEFLIYPPRCHGDPGGVTAHEVIGGNPPIQYSIDGGITYQDVSLFAHIPSGNYTMLIQDAAGCTYAEDFTIPEVPEIGIDLLPQVEIEWGEDYQINAFANISEDEIREITWTPSTFLSCDDCLNPTAVHPLESMIYYLHVVNQSGCAASARLHLIVKSPKDVYIPNAFSPNGDGANDLFMIFANAEHITNIRTFKVFDRWGEMVHEAHNFLPNDPAYGWDGMLRQQALNPAVFVYFAEIEFRDGEVLLFEGSVTLVR